MIANFSPLDSYLSEPGVCPNDPAEVTSLFLCCFFLPVGELTACLSLAHACVVSLLVILSLCLGIPLVVLLARKVPGSLCYVTFGRCGFIRKFISFI